MSHHHQIDYLELPATDLPRTKLFYQELFGWTFEDYGDSYTSFHDGRLAGGFTKVDAVTRGGPLPVLYSNDIESSLAAVQAAGGEIVQELFEFPGGRRFHFVDPNGNELAIWSES